MAERLCVYTGSIEPVTKGHLDIIERAASLFDEVIVAVLHNPAKVGRFPVERRLDLLRKSCAHLPNVSFDSFGGLLVDFMRSRDARIVIRGLRGTAEFESEFNMAQLNHQLHSQVETLFLTTDPAYASLSSSAVREIGMFGGDVTPFVPAGIAQEVATILRDC